MVQVAASTVGSDGQFRPWIGRAGCAFFRKSFLGRSVRISTMGLKYEPQRGPRLALASSCERIRRAIGFFPTESS